MHAYVDVLPQRAEGAEPRFFAREGAFSTRRSQRSGLEISVIINDADANEELALARAMENSQIEFSMKATGGSKEGGAQTSVAGAGVWMGGRLEALQERDGVGNALEDRIEETRIAEVLQSRTLRAIHVMNFRE